MSFNGKATYSAGPNLPELAEDVSDIIGIVSPYETPLLDHLGDPRRAARVKSSKKCTLWRERSRMPRISSTLKRWRR